jgi:hypothetical protein
MKSKNFRIANTSRYRVKQNSTGKGTMNQGCHRFVGREISVDPFEEGILVHPNVPGSAVNSKIPKYCHKDTKFPRKYRAETTKSE